MLTLWKYRTKVSIKKLISIAVIWWRSKDWLWHFDNVLRDDFVRFFKILIIWRSFFLNFELRRNIFFKTHCSFPVDFLELRFFGDFLILVKQRIFRLTEFFLENEFTSHKELTCNYNIQKTILIRINVTMLVNMSVKFCDLGFNFIYQWLILDFFYSLMSQ